MAMNVLRSEFEYFAVLVEKMAREKMKFIVYEPNRNVHLLGQMSYCSDFNQAMEQLHDKPELIQKIMPVASVRDAVLEWWYWPNERFDAYGWKNRQFIDVEQMVDAMRLLYQNKPTIWFNTRKKENIMNQENYKYVADQVKYGGGFGDAMHADIKSNFEKGMEKSSTVLVKQHGTNVAESTLNFSKSKDTDMQFWNSFNMKVRFEDGTEKSQTFKVDRINKNIITENEAYKLLTGASLLKEFKTGPESLEKKWLVLDEHGPDGNRKLLNFGEKHGFDLRGMLNKLPIQDKHMQGIVEGIADTLERGYKANVTYQVDGDERKVTLSAKPRYKAIEQVDSAGNKTTHQQNVLLSKELKPHEQEQKADKGQNEKQNDGEDSPSSMQVKQSAARNVASEKQGKPKSKKRAQGL